LVAVPAAQQVQLDLVFQADQVAVVLEKVLVPADQLHNLHQVVQQVMEMLEELVVQLVLELLVVAVVQVVPELQAQLAAVQVLVTVVQV
jgi:hypothetical protein